MERPAGMVGMGKPGVIHRFATSLAGERVDTRDPRLHAVLKDLFPLALSMVINDSDMAKQKAGVDVRIKMPDGSEVTIDLKFRGERREDIALEYLSDSKRGTPGWVVDGKKTCDFIGYIFKTSWVCYLIPMLQLRTAWFANRRLWLAHYGTKLAHNDGWTTSFCPVPIRELMAAVPGVRIGRPEA